MIKKVINKIYSSGARPREPEPRKENKIINNIYIYINDKQEAIWGPLIIIIFNNNRDPPSININIKIIYKYLNNILLYK